MKIFLTGSTGFVGTEVLRKLLEYGHQVVALVREASGLTVEHESLSVIKGDVLVPDTYQSELGDCDTVIHLVGIIREIPSKNVTFDRLHTEATIAIVAAAKAAGVSRFVQMSANGTRENSETDYHRTKYEAEQAVIQSGLDYTILRPSVIYGPRDIFINMLTDFMKLTPVFSYFGKGDQLMQPVSVFEVAEIFAKAVDASGITNDIFTVCGSKVFEYKDLLKMIMRVKGFSRMLMPVPIGAIKVGVSLFGKQSWFPITRDQFVMLIEGNVCDNREIFDKLNVNSLDIETVLKEYL